MDRAFLILGYGSWGKASTLDLAVKRWRARADTGTTRTVIVTIVDVHRGATVDDDGNVTTPAGEDPPQVLRQQEVQLW